MSSAIPNPTPSILLQTEGKRFEFVGSDDDFVTYDLTRYDNETTSTTTQKDKASSSSLPSFRALGLVHMEEHCGMTERRQQQQQQQGQHSWRVLQEGSSQTLMVDCRCSFSDGTTILDPWHPFAGSSGSAVVGDGGGTSCLHGENIEKETIIAAAAAAAAAAAEAAEAAAASFRQELQRASHRQEAIQKDVEVLQAICQQLEQDFYIMVQERDIWKERSLQQEDTIQHLMDHSNQLEEVLEWTEKNQQSSSFWSVSSSLRPIPGQQPHLNTICIHADGSSDCSSSRNSRSNSHRSNVFVALASSMHATQPILLSDRSANFIIADSDTTNENLMQPHRHLQEDQKRKDDKPVTTRTATTVTTTTTTTTTTPVTASKSSNSINSSSIIILESFLKELLPF
jgi:hypothetical protein